MHPRVKRFILLVICVIVVYNIIRWEIADTNDKTTKLGNCTLINPTRLLATSKIGRFSNGIPKVVHLFYRSHFIPFQYTPFVTRCVELNPDVVFVLWTDVSALNFLKTNSPRYFNTYKDYLLSNDVSRKSNILRFFILSILGGVYMDLDTRCQKPLKVAMKNDSCILGKQIEVQAQILYGMDNVAVNSFMACVPRHEFFTFLLINIPDYDHDLINWHSGPIFLTQMYNKYSDLHKDLSKLKTPTKRLSIRSSDTYTSYLDYTLDQICAKPIGDVKIKACQELVTYKKSAQRIISKAVVVHLMLHVNHNLVNQNLSELRDICDIQLMKLVQ